MVKTTIPDQLSKMAVVWETHWSSNVPLAKTPAPTTIRRTQTRALRET
jgi:hypothetical protein